MQNKARIVKILAQKRYLNTYLPIMSKQQRFFNFRISINLRILKRGFIDKTGISLNTCYEESTHEYDYLIRL